MDTLIQDFRYGLRMLAKRPAITAIAVISLALGIGANTTIFTMVNAVFLNSIPVHDSASLVQMFTEDERGTGFGLSGSSYPNSVDYRDQNNVLEGQTSFLQFGQVAFRIEGDEGAAQNLPFQLVSGNYFDVLGVEPAIGRLFSFPRAEDDRLGAHAEVVISHGLWERRFGGSPEAVGSIVLLNSFPFVIVGIATENFKGTQNVAAADQIWIHLSMREQVVPPQFVRFFDSRRMLMVTNIGRLKEGITIEQAQAEFTTIAKRLEQEYPEPNTGRTMRLLPFSGINPNQRGQFASAGTLLMSIVGLVLLIACANVANLLLARAVEREKEISVRIALGAKRFRLVRQLLTESVLLAVAGGLGGLIIAFWTRDILWSFRPPFLGANSVDLSLDPRVLGFTVLISLLTGVVFGLIPSLQASNPNLAETLQEGGRRGSSGTSKAWLRSGLVVGEVALAIVTLIGAGLFVRSMVNAQRIDPGYETEKLFTLFLDTTTAGYSLEQAEQFFDQLLPRIEAVSGVDRASLSQGFGGFLMRSVFPEGVDLDPDQQVLTNANTVTPGFFQAAGIPMLRGRDFTIMDDEAGPYVAIANEAMVERFWPGENPIGKRFQFFANENDRHFQQQVEIIGLVKNAALAIGQPPAPVVYTPAKQWWGPAYTVNVRTAADPEAVMGTVQTLVREMEPNLPIGNVATVGQNLAQQLWAPRMGAGMLAIFGLLALALAMVGIYGVMSNSVDQRAHEMGIRMALGAGRGQVVQLMVKQGMTLVGIGVVVGLAVAFWAGRLLQNMLFDMSANDPVTYLGVALGLLLVALFATWLPARRLTALDPSLALRAE